MMIEFLTNLWNKISNKDINEELVYLNNELEKKVDKLEIQLEDYNKVKADLILSYDKKIELLNKIIIGLEQEDKDFQQEEELEKYWNSKYKISNYVYPARPIFLANGELFSQANVDPRIFFSNLADMNIPKFMGTNDEIAIKAQNYVIKNITYAKEDKELWQFYYETLARKAGDCDDGAILMAMIMVASGIPYWRVRINAGNVLGGGHAYVCYLRESNNKWYVMDWCYWASQSSNFKMPWKKAEKYYSDTDGKKGFSVWFSFNMKYIFGDLPKDL